MRGVPKHKQPQGRRPLAGAAVLVAVALAACSSDDDGAAERVRATTTSTNSSTTTTTASDSGAAAVAAYRAFWQDFLAAGDPINPQDPRLAAHATGEQLATVRKSFLAVEAAGQVVRGSLDLAPRVVSVDDATVVLSDCYDDMTGLYSPDGVRQDKEDPQRHLITATVVFIDGAWKVSAVRHEGDGCTAS